MSGFRKAHTSASFTVNLDNQSEKSCSASSLQDSFKNYRDQKLDEIRQKINEANKNTRKSFRSNPDRMMKLRLKFVQQAKKYFNVPYAKKYFSPESPEYQSKLFLDCCGLVRRVMRDLEYDFGFRIGGGNQAYMYDTLPKTIDNLEDVKPGDLVFIQAIYYNPQMKKQPHNITHVEIMLGEGEKTIGARWNNGKVQVFDSYKFVSKSYHSQVYYIKSIDPWLKGLCRSCCPKHPWRYNTTLRYKKSIFYLDQEKKFKNSLSANNQLKLKKKKKKKKKKKTKTKKSTVKCLQSENDNAVQSIGPKTELNEQIDEQEENSEEESDEQDSQNDNQFENQMTDEEQDEPAEQQGQFTECFDDFYLNKPEKLTNEMRPFTSIERDCNMLNINS